MQFDRFLSPLLLCPSLSLPQAHRSKTLVTGIISLLEVIICWRTRSTQYHDPVFIPRALCERTEAVLLQEFVAIQELACRLTACHQEHVVAHQRRWIQKPDKSVDYHGEWHGIVIDSLGECDLFVIHVDENLCEGRADEVHCKQGRGGDEGEEVAIVAAPDAVVEPYTVVVGGLDTVVAHAAVVRTWRTPNLACLTILGRDLHGSS